METSPTAPLHLTPDFTATSGNIIGLNNIGLHTPSGTSTASFFNTYSEARVSGAQNSGTTYGMFSASRMLSSATTTSLLGGIQGFGFFGSTSTGWTNITRAVGGYFAGTNHFTNNPTGTVINSNGVLVDSSKRGGTNITFTYASGININEQNNGTHNTNLMIGSLQQPTGNFSIYNSSTDSNYFAGVLSVDKNISAMDSLVVGASVAPKHQLSITDATDTYGFSVSTDGLRIYNDNATPENIVVIDSIGRIGAGVGTDVIIADSGHAAIQIDGDDGNNEAGVGQIYENGGTMWMGGRHGLRYMLDNDNNATTMTFGIYANGATGTELLSITETGSISKITSTATEGVFGVPPIVDTVVRAAQTAAISAANFAAAEIGRAHV
jgi:hypothetical protein